MENASVLREVLEKGFGGGDLTVADRCAGPTFVEHEYGAPQLESGAATLRAQIETARGEVAGLTMTVEEMVEVGDKVWARSTGRGTDPRSGQELTLTVMDVCRFEEGRIVEHWGVPDRFALLHQLGVLPDRPVEPV